MGTDTVSQVWIPTLVPFAQSLELWSAEFCGPLERPRMQDAVELDNSAVESDCKSIPQQLGSLGTGDIQHGVPGSCETGWIVFQILTLVQTGEARLSWLPSSNNCVRAAEWFVGCLSFTRPYEPTLTLEHTNPGTKAAKKVQQNLITCWQTYQNDQGLICRFNSAGSLGA